MARRMTESEYKGLGLAILIGSIIMAVVKIADAIGYTAPLTVCGAGVLLFIWQKVRRNSKRLKFLRDKYKDEEVVQRIFHHRFWQGQTSEQLIDSLGKPASIDKKVFKMNTRDTWKYDPRGVNRYGLRITLDDGIVIGWDQKSRQ